MTEGPGGVGAGGAGRAVPEPPEGVAAAAGRPSDAGCVNSRQGVEVLSRGDDADDVGEGAGGARAGRRTWVRALQTHFGTLAGVAIIGVLLWRMGTGVFLDGLRRIDTPALLLALAIGGVTTVFSAWRWALVARGLKIRLPLGAAVGDYYRALFLNAALPGGILGDVHRAVRHGQSEGDVGRGVRAVFWERVAGQLALAAVGLVVLLAVESPVAGEVRHVVPLALLAGVGALAVLLAVRMN
ncbi:lysylphosphatidylglycerol synthase transmembrane domain-containing protein, partial [Streptomyces sp. S6]